MTEEQALAIASAATAQIVAERDRYRTALEQINREFIECANGEVKTYAGPVAALDCIRIEVRKALGLPERPRQDSNLQPRA